MVTTPAELGKLIMDINPYTKDNAGNPTTDMDIFVGNPNPPTTANNYIQVELLFDAEYAGDWIFRGEAQHIASAARIRYRYPVKDKVTNATLYWKSDYLLIGFAGSGGP
jgi:hypothetical protein